MNAPKPVQTATATANNVRRGDETAARRLRGHGWLVVPPEEIAAFYADVIARAGRMPPPPEPA